jgi:hypothetical protein
MSKWYKKVFQSSHYENTGYPQKNLDLCGSSLALQYGDRPSEAVYSGSNNFLKYVVMTSVFLAALLRRPSCVQTGEI